MNKSIFMSRESIPEYQSSVISRNCDGTYNVKHIFTDGAGKEISIEYPKVKIMIDTSVDIFSPFPRVFPFGEVQVFPYGNAEELFTLTIEG